MINQIIYEFVFYLLFGIHFLSLGLAIMIIIVKIIDKIDKGVFGNARNNQTI